MVRTEQPHDLADGAGAPGATLAVRAETVARALVVIAALLVVVGLIAHVLVYQVASDLEAPLARVAARLDLGLEPSVPAWWSSLVLVACSILLILVACGWREDRWMARRWAALSILFFVLAADEAVLIHEMANDDLLDTSGPLFFAWVIPGAIFTIAMALAFLPFLRRLDRRTRNLFALTGSSSSVGLSAWS